MSYAQVVTDTLALLISALSLLTDRKPAIMSALLMLLIEVHSHPLTSAYACAFLGQRLCFGVKVIRTSHAEPCQSWYIHRSWVRQPRCLGQSTLEGLGPLYQSIHVVQIWICTQVRLGRGRAMKPGACL